MRIIPINQWGLMLGSTMPRPPVTTSSGKTTCKFTCIPGSHSQKLMAGSINLLKSQALCYRNNPKSRQLLGSILHKHYTTGERLQLFHWIFIDMALIPALFHDFAKILINKCTNSPLCHYLASMSHSQEGAQATKRSESLSFCTSINSIVVLHYATRVCSFIFDACS